MKRLHSRWIAVVVASLVGGACADKKDESKTSAARGPAVLRQASAEVSEEDGYGRGGMALDEGKMGRREKADAPGRYAMKKGADKSVAAAPSAPEAMELEADLDDAAGGEAAPATRAWFPETFLFEPLVVTDEQGAASVRVRVPDRLTTWRVLGLAHSRDGAQAGAVASFLGTLPTYVDPVVPPFLRAGDEVRLPVQVVNTTDEPVATTLTVSASGASISGGSGAVRLPANGSAVRYVTLRTQRPGTVKLLARIGAADEVVREIEVLPTGRPVTTTKSGTLAAPRELAIVGPAQSDPTLGRARLTVFPGALAILRSELASSGSRGGVADDAFALLLAGKAPELLRALGDEPDAEALRKLTILTSQRVIRHARVLDINTATLVAEAALAHADNPVIERLGKRAVDTIEREQAPDGTCGGANGWTLQRLLVATADCTRAAHGSQFVPIRAAAAFERNAKEIADPYTAAAILATGIVSERLAETLREQVRGAIEQREDGSRVLVVPDGVVRADGQRPSTIEATALAVLALAGDAKAPLADLGAAVLAGYSPYYGWGDGRTNLVAMRAVLELFKQPVPDNVKIALLFDGAPVAEGTLDRDHVRELMTLEAEGLNASGSHQWTVRAEPAVPGLGFNLVLTSWAPWEPPPEGTGLELVVAPRGKVAVGAPVELAIAAGAPAGRAFTIELALPTGAQADTTSLTALVNGGAIARYEQSDEQLTLHVNPLEPGQAFAASVRVIPTLGGSLQTGPASIELDGTRITLPPTRWTVK